MHSLRYRRAYRGHVEEHFSFNYLGRAGLNNKINLRNKWWYFSVNATVEVDESCLSISIIRGIRSGTSIRLPSSYVCWQAIMSDSSTFAIINSHLNSRVSPKISVRGLSPYVLMGVDCQRKVLGRVSAYPSSFLSVGVTICRLLCPPETWITSSCRLLSSGLCGKVDTGTAIHTCRVYHRNDNDNNTVDHLSDNREILSTFSCGDDSYPSIT